MNCGRVFFCLCLALNIFAPRALTISPPETCPAGAPIGKLDLRTFLVGKSEALPLRTVNQLGEGNRIAYKPILRHDEKRPGEVALVLLPVTPESADERLIV